MQNYVTNRRSEPEASPPAIFYRVARRAHSLINRICRQASPDNVEYLRSSYSSSDYTEIDYDRFAEAFAYAYFLKNFWKASGTFLDERPPLARTVIDAGCGSGATILAYLSFLDHSLDQAKWQIKIVLMDRSKVQLRLARQMFEDACVEFNNLEVVTEFRHLDLRQWQPEDGSADSILFGHVLTENRKEIGSFLEKALCAVRESGRIYVIERTDDSVWPLVETYAPQLALPPCYGLAEIDTKSIKLPRLVDTERKAYVKTRFLALHVPERKILVELLRLYFDAWRSQSVPMLDDLFAPFAEYHDKPHMPPHCGIERIRQYWREHVLSQMGTELKLLRVAYNGTEAFTEWNASFVQWNRKVRLTGALILKVDPDIRRVVALHEYYHSQKSEA